MINLMFEFIFIFMGFLGFQYNVLMRLGKLEEAIDKLTGHVTKLGNRIEPEDSIFNFTKVECYDQFLEFESQLKNEKLKK